MKIIVCDLCGERVHDNWQVFYQGKVKGKCGKSIDVLVQSVDDEHEDHICPKCLAKISEALQAINF